MFLFYILILPFKIYKAMVVGCCRKVMYMCNQVSNRLLFRSNLPLSFPNKSWCITWVSCRHRLTSKWCNHIFTIMACFVLIYNEFCFAVSWCCLLHPYFPSFSVVPHPVTYVCTSSYKRPNYKIQHIGFFKDDETLWK